MKRLIIAVIFILCAVQQAMAFVTPNGVKGLMIDVPITSERPSVLICGEKVEPFRKTFYLAKFVFRFEQNNLMQAEFQASIPLNQRNDNKDKLALLRKELTTYHSTKLNRLIEKVELKDVAVQTTVISNGLSRDGKNYSFNVTTTFREPIFEKQRERAAARQKVLNQIANTEKAIQDQTRQKQRAESEIRRQTNSVKTLDTSINKAKRELESQKTTLSLLP